MTSVGERERYPETGNYYSILSSLLFFPHSILFSYEIILECRDCTSSLYSFFSFQFEIIKTGKCLKEKEKSECFEITRPVSIIRFFFTCKDEIIELCKKWKWKKNGGRNRVERCPEISLADWFVLGSSSDKNPNGISHTCSRERLVTNRSHLNWNYLNFHRRYNIYLRRWWDSLSEWNFSFIYYFSFYQFSIVTL